MIVFKKLKEYCKTIYEQPMAIVVFSFVMSSAVVFGMSRMVREGIIHWFYIIVAFMSFPTVFLPMYLMGKHWTKVDKK